MPWPNSPSSTGEPRGGSESWDSYSGNMDWKRRNHKKEVQASEAKQNADELERLAIYLREHFPKQAATKEKTVDVVIDLLNELKKRRESPMDYC